MLSGFSQEVAQFGQNPLSKFVDLSDESFFLSGDKELGRHLWVTDGTPSGTRIVKDFAPSETYEHQSQLLVFQDAIYFVERSILWRTDGTADGTLPISNGNEVKSDPTLLGDRIFFFAQDTHGLEPWASDGTPAGTKILKDTCSNCWAFGGGVTFNDEFYFSSGKGVGSNEIWKTDGTSDGTLFVASFEHDYAIPVGGVGDSMLVQTTIANTGSTWATWLLDPTTNGKMQLPELDSPFVLRNPRSVDLGDITLFEAPTKRNGWELWTSDGTTDGTQLLLDIHPGYRDGVRSNDPWNFLETQAEIQAIGSTAYFAANDGVHGSELWVTDGTTVGTRMLVDRNAGFGGSNPRQLTEICGQLWFIADDVTHGSKLWQLDPETNSLTMVQEVVSDGASSKTLELNQFGCSVVFTVEAADGTQMVWSVDASQSSPTHLYQRGRQQSPTDTIELVGSGSDQFFFATITPGGDALLWSTDGSSSAPIADFADRTANTREFSAFQLLPHGAVFQAEDRLHGAELWFSDMTDHGTRLVADIFPGEQDSFNIFSTFEGALFQGVYYFAADNGIHGSELWRTDGTPEGTYQLKDLNPGAGDSSPGHFTVVHDRLFFHASTQRGLELWISDGTTNGTRMLTEHPTSATSPYPVSLQVEFLGDRFVFAGSDGLHGTELWETDGSEAGTRLLRDIASGPASSIPTEFQVKDGELYFSANDGIHGNELWKTDGTLEGTVLLKDLVVGIGSSNPKALTLFEGKVFFAAASGLWESDGTTEGTRFVTTIPNLQSRIYIAGEMMFFAADDRLWRSDGTRAGTQVIASNSPQNFVEGSDRLYFIQDDEIWTSDGSAAGTFTLEKHPEARNITQLALLDEDLIFSTEHPIHGRKLWKLPLNSETVILEGPPNSVEIFDENGSYVVKHGSDVVFTAPLSTVSRLIISGNAAVDEIVVSFSSGEVIPEGGIVVKESCCQNVRVTLRGSADDSVTHSFTDSQAHRIVVDGRELYFEGGILSVEDYLNVRHRTIELPGGDNDVVVSDDPAHVSQTRVADSTSGIQVSFPANAEHVIVDVHDGSNRFKVDETTRSLPGSLFVKSSLDPSAALSTQLPANWRLLQRGQDGGRSTFIYSNGTNRVAIYGDDDTWRNPIDNYDVNGDGLVTSADVLAVVNELHRDSSRPLIMPADADEDAGFVDVNGDRHLSPIDALQIVNVLNRAAQQPAGEGGAISVPGKSEQFSYLHHRFGKQQQKRSDAVEVSTRSPPSPAAYDWGDGQDNYPLLPYPSQKRSAPLVEAVLDVISEDVTKRWESLTQY